MRWFIWIAGLLLTTTGTLTAQVPGVPGTGAPQPKPQDEPINSPSDTLFIFEPVRPLIDSSAVTDNYDDSFGLDVLFSNSGFGLGGYYQHNYSGSLAGFINLGISGARKSDEFEEFDFNPESPHYGTWAVPNKVNRLFMFPLMVGIRYRVLDEVLVDNFRPYLNLGAGPNMVLALPYNYEFFTSFGHAVAHFSAGGFVGLGAELGNRRPVLGVNIRYYYLPMNPGVESLRNEPITDFGGLFVTMNIGFVQ